MISIYNSVESPIKDIEILGNTVDGVSVGILQDDGQYKITLFTNNGLDNMSPDYREDKEELLLPCQLEKIGDSTDRLYYDKEEKAWCIYKVSQSKIVLPITFTISLNSFYGTTNLYMVSGEVEGTIKAKVSKSLGASVSSLNDKADVLIDKIDAMLGGRVDLDGYATIEYVDVKDEEIKGVLDNMFEEYTEEQISVDFPNASTISIVDNEDLFTSTTIEGALRELANNSGSGNAEGIKFDNSSNEMTSVNVQDAIEENKTSILNIETELSKTENTSYTTANGIKEFECKDGYVDNVVIEGETLVNLALQNTTNTTNPRNRVECNNVMGATEFTVINKSSLTLKVDIFENGEYKRYTEHPSNTSIFVRLEEGEILGAYTFIFTEESNEATLQEFKKGFVILEGDHTDKHISYFEGLKSVGQGDKIEVLTYIDNKSSKIDLSSVTWVDNKHLKYTNLEENISGYSYTSTYIPISFKLGESLIIENGNPNMCFYDENQNYIPHKLPWYSSDVRISIAPIPINAKYFRITVPINNKNLVNVYLVKQDKKQILTTLRSLPNGVKDTIGKRGNKYYKIKRCGEYTITGNEGITMTSSTLNVFNIPYALNSTKSLYLLCDKYQMLTSSGTKQGILYDYSNNRFRVTDGNFTSVDNFVTELKSNPVTVVYELATPIIEELPNFNPQTFSDKTTLLLNSGVVQAEASFEVTNSLGSELEVLKGKVSDLDNNYVRDIPIQYLNGWSGDLVCKVENKQVTIQGMLHGQDAGVKSARTFVLKLPIDSKAIQITAIGLHNAFGQYIGAVELTRDNEIKICHSDLTYNGNYIGLNLSWYLHQ